MMLVDMRVFFNMSDYIKYMRVGGRRHRARRGNLEEKTREDADIRMYYLVPRFEFVHQGRDMLL